MFVDGSSKVTFEKADAAFHSFKLYSQYDYLVYLFVSILNPKEEIEKILCKYPNTIVHQINPLIGLEKYSEWMLKYPWYVIDPKHENILTFQDDSAIIKEGWEDYFLDGKWDYAGSPWRSDITVLTKNGPLKTLRVGNGGISARKRTAIIKVIEYINSNGGQHKYFTGIKINDVLKQQNSWLAEDAAICSVGATFDLLNLPTEEQARKFGHEPIELSLYMDKENETRPWVMHKCDN